MTKHNILRKRYTLNGRNYRLKIPMELDACIPEADCVRLSASLHAELDLAALYGTYKRMTSEKYASTEIMLKVMLYATMKGRTSLQGLSRRTAGGTCSP